MKIFFCVFALVILAGVPSFAYYSVLETGTLVAPGNYRITASPQYIMSGEKGLNVAGRFDVGLTESASARAIFGVGEVDVFLGGSFKWIPIPDYESQPAFGIIGSFIFGDYNDVDIFTARIAPIISKQFDSNIGMITPYFAVPFGVAAYDSTSDNPVNLALGTEFKSLHSETVKFLLELGIKMNNDSFSYITFGVAWDLVQ